VRFSIPAVLHACQESRVEAKKRKSIILGAALGRLVYFDFETDILLIKGNDRINYDSYDTILAFMNWIRAKKEHGEKALKDLQRDVRHLAVDGRAY